MNVPEASGLQGEPREVPREVHRQQLRGFASACAELSRLFGAEGQTWFAEAFAQRAMEAQRLLDAGFKQSELNALTMEFPTPEWLDPKYLDYNAPRDDWQELAAPIHSRARLIAAELRTVATFDAQ